MGATQCLTISVTDDNVYGANSVLTITLSKMADSPIRLVLGNTVTMVTINDDDGETVSFNRCIAILSV